MFRRKRVQQAQWQVPRVRKRAEGGHAEPDLIGKVESAVRNTIGLVRSLVVLLLRLLFQPFRLERYMDRSGRVEGAMPPYTFLALAVFLAGKSMRVLITTFFLAWLAFARSCSPETVVPPTYPKGTELFQLPSAEELLLTGLPTIALVVLVLMGITRLIRRSSEDAGTRLMNASLYIVGLQYLLILAAVVVAMPENFDPTALLEEAHGKGADDSEAAATGDAEHKDFGWTGFLVASGLAILWPAFLFAARLRNACPASEGRRLGRAAGIVLLALLMSLGTLLAGIVATFPLSRVDVMKQAVPRPLFRAVMLDEEGTDPAAGIRRTLMLTNRSTSELRLRTAMLQYQGEPGERFVPARPPAQATAADGLVLLKPGESRLVVAAFVGDGNDKNKAWSCDDGPFSRPGDWKNEARKVRATQLGSSKEGGTSWMLQRFMDTLLGDLDYPVPRNVKARLCVARILEDGSHVATKGFVLDGRPR